MSCNLKWFKQQPVLVENQKRWHIPPLPPPKYKNCLQIIWCRDFIQFPAFWKVSSKHLWARNTMAKLGVGGEGWNNLCNLCPIFWPECLNKKIILWSTWCIFQSVLQFPISGNVLCPHGSLWQGVLEYNCATHDN